MIEQIKTFKGNSLAIEVIGYDERYFDISQIGKAIKFVSTKE